ncbi:MAG: N-acetyl-1-D-myo-inositol-2-amino-2-deoxy-alpha-D-glucopyranoside deacetylase [Chloroflexota bacterium]
MSCGCVVGVFAHPDDESLLAGGTLAAAGACGFRVVILSVSRGELGPISDRVVATRDTLAAVRTGELVAAGAILGARESVCLDFPDGSLRWVDSDLLSSAIEERLRVWRPRAVITFGAEGLYWHSDHIAVHKAVHRALGALSTHGSQPVCYEATWPTCLACELADAMKGRDLSQDLWGLNCNDFGVPPECITTVLDVRPFLVQKMRALRAHRSQIGADQLLDSLPSDLATQFLGDEYFMVPAQTPVGVDVLAEIARSMTQ